ncbi:MAG: cytochrome ubiquinol oxidase subunit I [Candidatus Zixiibacteriota bacterium]
MELLYARLQMALTLGFHIILACLGVGFPVLMLFAEWRFLRTRDELWLTLARRWSKSFAVLFAVGAVSGTVLSFELGLLWPEFMKTFSGVFGVPFALEGFAFFIEAIFLGIYLYGWDKLSSRSHFLSGIPLAIAGVASAWLVVAVNSWMNTPQGFTMLDGIVTDTDPWAAMLNPATGAQTTHMIAAAYMVTGFLIAAVYAVSILKGKSTEYNKRALILGLSLACLIAPIQIVIGHWAGTVVAKTQPVKLAAMEGQFRTEARAPLRLGGIPDENAQVTRYALEIPGGLSWMAYGNADSVVTGLEDFAPEDCPPVAIVHMAFQIMVVCGCSFLVLAVWLGLMYVKKGQIQFSRMFLWLVVLAGPLSAVALETGWVVTEVGRQPWIVTGIMRTSEAVTPAPGIAWLFYVTIGIYSILAGGTILVLRKLACAPLGEKYNGS